MSEADPTASPEAVTELILRVFRLNGRLLAAGDRLVGPLGLTSARWQILGGIAAAGRPQPVVGLARDLGISRQAVQRIVNDLARAGIVTFETNPRNKRAQLVVFTDRGRALYEKASKLQRPWVTALANGITTTQVRVASHALDHLLNGLDRGKISASAAKGSRRDI